MPPQDADSAFREYRRTGDGAALASVFDAVAPELLLAAHHLGSVSAAAEDLVQATFLKAIRSAASFDATRPLRPWLFTILANEARAIRRVEKRGLDPNRLRHGGIPQPEECAEANEFSEIFARSLENLPENYRVVLTLRLVHGLTPTEIAHSLGRPPGTVKTWLHRGIENLRRALPAGFAASLAAVLTHERGLAAVRAVVLENAGAGSVLAAASAVSGRAIGKWITAGGALVVLAAVTAWAIHSGQPVAEFEAPTVAAPRPEPGASSAVPDARWRVAVTARGDDPEAETVEGRDGLLTEVTWSDGTAAEGVWVRLLSHHLANPHLHTRWLRTGVGGRAIAIDLQPGRWTITLDRAGEEVADVAAVGLTRVRLRLPAGVEIRGRAVDDAGRPVHGAAVWLSESGRYDRGCEVAVVDEHGHFALRDVEPGRALCVIADGFRPSSMHTVRDGDEQDVSVRLDQRGVTLSGRVVDVAGRPVAGASVLVDSGFVVPNADACAILDLRIPLRLWTDAGGRFHSTSVPPARNTNVWIRAPGFAPWSGSITTPANAGGAVELPLTLHAGATLMGTVVGFDSTMSLRVEAGPLQQNERDGVLTEHDFGPVWLRSHAAVAPDGSFRLDGLAAGRAHARLLTAGGPVVHSEVALQSGHATTWNPARDAAQRIVGAVRDAAGRPLAGWQVVAASRRVTTDDRGAFALDGCSAEPHDLEVIAPGPWQYPAAIVLQACPRDEPLRITVPLTAVPRADVRGILHDHRGNPLALPVSVVSDGRVATVDSDDLGAFCLGPLPAAPFHLVVRRGPDTLAVLGPLTLRDDLDLRTLTLRPPGRLVLCAVDGTGHPLRRGMVQLYTASGLALTSVLVEDGGARATLPAGRYRYTVSGERYGIASSTFEITPDAATERRVMVAANAPQRVVVDHPYRRPRLRLDMTLRDSGGAIIWQMYAVRRHAPGRPQEIEIDSPAGDFVLAVGSDCGLRGSVSIHTALGTPQLGPTQLVMQ